MKFWNHLGILLYFLAFSFTQAFAEEGSNWPRKIERNDATIVIYQPQVESLTENTLASRAAVSVTSDEYSSPVFGAMWFDCRISTDRDDRMVELLDLKVSAAKFPDIEEEKILRLSELLEEEIPKWELDLSLDGLLADLEMEQVHTELAENLNNAPPEIIFRTTPTNLVMVDGDPRFEKIEKTNYERVVNTPYFIVRDSKKDTYYINGAGHWYVSENFDRWEATTKVPNKLEKIAKEAMGEEEAADTSGGDEGEVKDENVVPAIVVRTAPAELIQSDGEPAYETIEGTSILFMSNTADNILMNIETQEYYILVAGRWYSSKSLTEGPWVFVDPEGVPEGFSDIPAESDMAAVRAHIAGTNEAKEALLENQIPQTAEVDRKEAKLEVSYDGQPKFEAIEGTNMQYAINTDKSILLIDNRYYCCDNAIWFESDSPKGPWVVSTVVPENVQDIPPESPVYNVKYVYIYDSTPDVVYVGYTPGYVHSYAYMGCVYYGTGHYYTPWYGAYYYPRPVTYGYSVHYNPYTGWGFSFGVSYGWMTFGWGAPYRGWWGPCGYRHGYHYGYRHGYHNGYRAGYRAGYHAGQRSAYNRPTPYSNRARPTNNVYTNRAQGVRTTGNHQYDPRTGNRVGTTDRGKPSARPANTPNNVYTDRNGNVYRKDGDNWNRVNNGQGATQRDARPSTGQQPNTGQTRPSTGQQPNTGQTRPSTGQQPNTGQTRPSTGQQPSTGQTRPSTGQTRPSTGQQPNTQQTRPSTSNNQAGTQNRSQLNRDSNSRSQGQQRSQGYQQSRPQYQQSRPSQPSRSVSPSRSGAGRSAAPRRR
jgi:hypothetical protein